MDTHDENGYVKRLKKAGLIGLSLICAMGITALLLGVVALRCVKPAQAKSHHAPNAIDLSITKSHSGDFLAGTPGTYVITVTNMGEAITTSQQVIVTDEIPTAFTLVSVVGTDWTVHTTGNKITATYDIASLGSGNSLPTIDINITVPSTYTSSTVITNTANLQMTGDVSAINNTFSDPTKVNPINLEVTKTVNTITPLDGAVVTYTITAKNYGPEPATNVRLTDKLPSSLTYSTHSFSATPAGQNYNSSNGLWTIGTLPKDAVATLTLVGRIVSGSGGTTITNIASGLTSNEPDSDTLNNSDSVDINVGNAPDLQIFKTDNQTSVSPGDEFTYTIFITNAGSASASGIIIQDVIPANLSYISDTSGITPGISGNTYSWVYPSSLAVGGTISFDLVVKAASSLSSISSLANVVSVSTTTAEGNKSNNTATDTDAVLAVDLEVTKSYSPATPLEGGLVTYDVVVTNNGPITATNVKLTDLMPSGITYSSYSVSSSPSGQTYAYASGLWTIGTLGDGMSATLKLVGRINLGTDDDTIENTASGLTSDYVDYNTSNNSASVSFKVKGAPDLQIQKTDYQTTISPGDEFTYTVFITNAGSEDATGIVITDVLPTYLSYITDTLQTLGITYTLPTAKTYRWDYPFDIEAGDVLTYQLGVLAASSMAGTTQVNSISVSTDTAEGNTSNNTATDSNTISYTPSVSFSKSVSPVQQALNGYMTFYIYVTNNSSVSISSVVVKDTFNTTYLDIASVSTTRGSASYNSSTNVVTVSIGTLAAGYSATITISCKVVSAATSVTYLTNYAYLNYYYGGSTLSKTASAAYRISSSSTTLPTTGGIVSAGNTAISNSMTAGVVVAIICSVLLFGLGIGLLVFSGRLKRQQSEWAGWCLRMGPVMLMVAIGFAVAAWGLSSFSNQPITQAPEPTQIAVMKEELITDLRPIDIPLSEDELEFLPDYPVPTPSFVPTPQNTEVPLDDTPPVRLLIPDLGIDTVVKYVPYEGDTWLISGLKQEVAWLGETSWPGLGGNTGLAGHVTLNSGENGPFRYLDQLTAGSVITLFTEKNIYNYKIRHSKVVDATDASVLSPTTQPSITLITCTNWDKDLHEYVKRFIVFADLDTTVPIAVNASEN